MTQISRETSWLHKLSIINQKLPASRPAGIFVTDPFPIYCFILIRFFLFLPVILFLFLLLVSVKCNIRRFICWLLLQRASNVASMTPPGADCPHKAIVLHNSGVLLLHINWFKGQSNVNWLGRIRSQLPLEIMVEIPAAVCEHILGHPKCCRNF